MLHDGIISYWKKTRLLHPQAFWENPISCNKLYCSYIFGSMVLLKPLGLMDMIETNQERKCIFYEIVS